MTYVHVPVQFSAPTKNDLRLFFDALDLHKERRVLVHCAANYRVTAFLGLYRVVRLGWARDDAFGLMRSVWEPNDVWAQFIAAVLGEQAQAAEGLAG
jgi:protein tyrosine phosphatase (PTP) superfamily phosphohydrolase (DUF442 family)